MSAHDANAPAHPTDPTMLDKGLTKREYIAAIALAATEFWYNCPGTSQASG
jgi:hypothetical protein